MKTCVRPGCRQSIATQTPQERNLLVRTKERAARRGVDGDRFPSLDTRSCSKKRKKKNYESQSSRMSRIETLVGFHLERARVCV